MLLDYAYVAGFAAAGFAFLLLAIFVGSLIQPKDPSGRKLTTYECGEIPVGQSWSQFNIRFYVFALCFVIFDIETIFLVPWALVFKSIGPVAFVDMAVFVGVLLIGLAYAWRKGALKWAL
ncbi:MAG: NADH-quinone oxidoreductase subunit A [Candidatus Eisenbacteria bacterium]|nr:NADH-quinone oxidoreductase subunit A [Candidatus Eisenbacteria bacterium]